MTDVEVKPSLTTNHPSVEEKQISKFKSVEIALQRFPE